MWLNPQFPADSVTFTEEIINGKLHFLRSGHCISRGNNLLTMICMCSFFLMESETAVTTCTMSVVQLESTSFHQRSGNLEKCYIFVHVIRILCLVTSSSKIDGFKLQKIFIPYAGSVFSQPRLDSFNMGKISVFFPRTVRDHSFSKYAKFSKKSTFFTTWYVHAHVRIRGLEMLLYRKLLRTH